jgi:hypothetical protein
MRAPSSSVFLLLLLLLLLLCLGGPADRRVTGAAAAPESSFRRSLAVTKTTSPMTTTSDDLPSSASTSVPRNNDDGTSGNGDDLTGGSQGAQVPGHNPNKDKATTITISVEPTQEPTPDASVEPTASPVSSDAVGEPATDDYHHPLYDRNNRTTGTFPSVSLLPFHVAYEPRFVGLDDVLASYRLLLWDGFRTAYSNVTKVRNVSLWNVTQVLFRESSTNTTATTTVSGKVWFQTKSSGNGGGVVPDRDDVVQVQALILAAVTRDHGATANADEIASSSTTSSNPATAGTIGGLVGFVLGGIVVGLAVRFWIRRTVDSKRAASPQLPFTRSADEFDTAGKPPGPGPPDRLVQFQFHAAAAAATEGSPPGSGTDKI